MILSTHTPSNVSLLSPTIFMLSDEHYQQAKSQSAQRYSEESYRWQHYLTQLGLLAFQDWLTESDVSATVSTSEAGVGYLQIDDFRLCILTTEQVLSERVEIPVPCTQASGVAHFYILLEVAEEQGEVWFRGLLRYDSLTSFISSGEVTTEAIAVPLSALELEPIRLLHYCHYLTPSSIPLPQASFSQQLTEADAATSPSLLRDTSSLRNKLSDWLNNVADEAWQAWDSLQPQVAYATRGLADGIKRGKLVNLGLDVGAQPVALVLTLTPEMDGRISVLVQLLPTGRDRTLPQNIDLSLVSKKGKVLQRIASRSQDNYIQLKAFKGTIGQQFSIAVQLGEASVSEDFEL